MGSLQIEIHFTNFSTIKFYNCNFICLARTILRKNKIVMINEVTANVDSETDEFIQNQLMKRFKKSLYLLLFIG